MIKDYLTYIPGIGGVNDDIEAFLKSDYPCCEIDITNYKDIYSARSAYNSFIKRADVQGVRPMMRQNRLYLVREGQ